MTTTGKHTAGPWKVYHENGSIGSGGHWGVESGDAPPGVNRSICRCVGWNDETPEETRANARLIAAAPDLLEALKAATERMEAVSAGILVENRAKGISQATHVRHMAGHLAQHAKLARAALDKAEGRGEC